ncbi:MAG TPA: type II toxin-antitoxin system RelE/ParE family toxin, partial [Gemmataceae bacterium]|nr:type II toxin-antitoxin system RelE/ParE family toxin [Gemmataceae bacterium]
MSLPVILRPEAAQDVASAENWYEQQAGLGQAFLDRLSEALDRIAATPEMYAVVWQEVRPCPLKRFPYVVYYRILADRIEVLAVLHGSRDPSVWQG